MITSFAKCFCEIKLSFKKGLKNYIIFIAIDTAYYDFITPVSAAQVIFMKEQRS